MLVRAITVMILCLTLSGCAPFADFFIPKHPQSDVRDHELVCLVFDPPPKEGLPLAALALPAAKWAAGFVIDRTAQLLKNEATRYQASYSARNSSVLFVRTFDDARNIYKTVRNTGGFTLSRYIGSGTKEGCNNISENSQAESVATFSSKMQLLVFDDFLLLKVDPYYFEFTKTKAKVPSPRWWAPWSWWMFLDQSKRKVDMKAQLSISVVSETKEGLRDTEFAKVDFPLGQYDLANLPVKSENLGTTSTSGWLTVPKLPMPKGEGPFGYATVTMSLVESDNMGDVIADAEKQLSTNKEKLIEMLVQSLGSGKGADKSK